MIVRRNKLKLNIDKDNQIAALAGELRDNSASVARMPAGLSEFIARLESRISRLENSDAVVDVPVPVAPAEPAAGAVGQYVMNRDTGVWHQVNAPEPDPPQHKKSRCGWLFATRKFERSNSLPPGVPHTKLCPRCLPVERELSLTLDLSDID